MAQIEFVDVATARSARGVRIVVSGLVPSPWSEATKGLFALAGVPVLAVRRMRDAGEINAWTGVDNVPVVFHDVEPARTGWAAITTLAARLAGGRGLLPDDVVSRAETMGLLHEIAGEEGIGWNGRIEMIEASLNSGGTHGFPLPVAQYLASRYGHSKEAVTRARARIPQQLRALHERLLAQRALGHAYLGGVQPSALDVYCATFLTPLSEITETDCPTLMPALRHAFLAAYEAFGALVPADLRTHRALMFERHLAYPIAL